MVTFATNQASQWFNQIHLSAGNKRRKQTSTVKTWRMERESSGNNTASSNLTRNIQLGQTLARKQISRQPPSSRQRLYLLKQTARQVSSVLSLFYGGGAIWRSLFGTAGGDASGRATTGPSSGGRMNHELDGVKLWLRKELECNHESIERRLREMIKVIRSVTERTREDAHEGITDALDFLNACGLRFQEGINTT
ncbi:unnamed protein product [Tilletia laevis]|uniref:Uncharacterized protein n=1 Tax=Tilletia laevis TaxID=157183 RepID=A0A9N8QIH5_9BASI|nr:unnamed protein product [Tilletia caries]CAD6929659.1 unnamed protein product [Tilletia laevis]CAD6951576.1 unnamed protein product [Tilletia laevis]CAD7067258.1 unnamed protein product [Tilletia caries]